MLWLYKLLKFIFRHVLPGPLRYPAARLAARLVCLASAPRRRLIETNLAPIVGAARARSLAPELLGNFAMTAVDFFCPRRDLLQHVEEVNASILDKAYRRHKKVMVVTAHLGNWELGMTYLIRKGYSMACVYAPYREDEVVRWIMGHRNPEAEWIPVGRGTVAACLSALERGKILVMAADIPFGEKGHPVHICGTWARLPLGPWAIAAQAHAAVVPGFVLRREPGRYRTVFCEAIQPLEGSLRRQIERTQNVYRQHLESYLKEYPEQWGCLQPFWDLRRDAVESEPVVERSALRAWP